MIEYTHDKVLILRFRRWRLEIDWRYEAVHLIKFTSDTEYTARKLL